MSILFAVLKKSPVQDISETSVDTCILFSRGSLSSGDADYGTTGKAQRPSFCFVVDIWKSREVFFFFFKSEDDSY